MTNGRIIRQRGNLRVVRTALGQVAEYDVYVGDKYMGGGTKREATKLFDTAAKEMDKRTKEVREVRSRERELRGRRKS